MNRPALTVVLFVALLPIPSAVRAQAVKAPEHDVRVLFDVQTLNEGIAKFNGLEYGDTIRLGEFPYYCGDPKFTMSIFDPPKLVARGHYNPSSGLPSTSLRLETWVRAKIHGKCFFTEDLAVAGHVQLEPDLDKLSSKERLDFHGSVGVWIILPFRFPFSASVPLPARVFGEIPVKLEPPEGIKFDFGELKGAVYWESSGLEKKIPVWMYAFSFGGAPPDSRYFALDASVGAEPRMLDFANTAAAQAFLESDVPLWDGASIGASVSESFFGEAFFDRKGSGFLAHLLPIRLVTRREVTVLDCAVTKQIEAIIDGGEVEMIQHNGGPAFRASLSTSRILMTTIQNDKPVPGTETVVNPGKFEGQLIFDRVRFEEGELRFRVADFRFNVDAGGLLFPIKLSAGGLEATLNKGKFAIGEIKDFVAEIPECVYTDVEKFKAGRGKCGEAPDGQRIGFLSHLSGQRIVTFKVDPNLLLCATNECIQERRLRVAARVSSQ